MLFQEKNCCFCKKETLKVGSRAFIAVIVFQVHCLLEPLYLVFFLLEDTVDFPGPCTTHCTLQF